MTDYQKLGRLSGQRIDSIPLHLDENVYGTNGDLTDEQILDRVIEDLREWFNYSAGDVIWLEQAAQVILSVWQAKDVDQRETFGNWDECPF